MKAATTAKSRLDSRVLPSEKTIHKHLQQVPFLRMFKACKLKA